MSYVYHISHSVTAGNRQQLPTATLQGQAGIDDGWMDEWTDVRSILIILSLKNNTTKYFC